MKLNESGMDRIIRVILGIALVGLDLGGVISGWVGIVGLVVGIVLVLTGAVGFCPLYAMFKLRTNKAS
jgi:Protein of unknown function (DUF2892)